MKFFSFLTIALLSFAPVRAAWGQSRDGAALLGRMAGHRVSFGYECTVDDVSYSGRITLQDTAFVMHGFGGMEVFSDGVTRWTVDTAAEEVLVENEKDAGILASPGRLVGAWEDFFTLSGDRFVPRRDCDISYVVIDACTENSLDASVLLSDGRTARFSLGDIVFAEKGPESDFVFDAASAGDSFIVTDLR